MFRTVLNVYRQWLFFVGLFVLSSCAATNSNTDGSLSDAVFSDGLLFCSDPLADQDEDEILNGEEGCLEKRDSDQDGTPDWLDYDSDNDGILDKTEAGQKDSDGNCKGIEAPNNSWPCDTDNDGLDDYLDEDSDADGVLDKHEDMNGDGFVGCCLVECNNPDVNWQQEKCKLNDDGCGRGQQCENGLCTPAVLFECSDGETSPLAKDTFDDGKLDSERGTFICRDATEDNPQGRKLIDTRQSTDGDWHVAFEKTAKYAELTISSPESKQAAAVFDEEDTQREVAGFIVSRSTSNTDVQVELTNILTDIHNYYAGGAGTVTVRASGTEGPTHDHFDGIRGSILDIMVSSASNISTVRNALVATLLKRSPSSLGNLPTPLGSSSNEFVIRFTIVRRFDQDNPDNQSKWRLLIMGAVATKDNYHDPMRETGFIVDDLSNGTTLATSIDEVVDECDVGDVLALPIADIIWVVDESGSMDDNREDIVANANHFFSRALAAGVDFRMGVTGVVDPKSSYQSYATGKFCSKISDDEDDDGGEDRFLLPTEQDIFSSCVRNPPGYESSSEYGLVNAKEAVIKHLPRTPNMADKIRPEATLVIIVVTDEGPQSLYSILMGMEKHCTLPPNTQTSLDQSLKVYMDLFTGVTDPEAALIFHAIAGVCFNSCDAVMAHGYKELVSTLGGQLGDVCQQDLGNTLQVIIDSIIAAASPVVLDFVPISTSLAVTLDGKQIDRARSNGFDYRESANSLVFMNVPFYKGSHVIASYKRWKKQEVIN